jgi:hypothetical protein
MKASDFILQIRDDLQEKSQHWSKESLFIKLQRAYVSLQFDLPFFITNETLEIKEGKSEYNLHFTPLENIGLKINNVAFGYSKPESFYITIQERRYTFNERLLIINHIPVKDCNGSIVYKYQKELENGMIF